MPGIEFVPSISTTLTRLRTECKQTSVFSLLIPWHSLVFHASISPLSSPSPSQHHLLVQARLRHAHPLHPIPPARAASNILSRARYCPLERRSFVLFSCDQLYAIDKQEADLIIDDAGETDFIQIEDMSKNQRPGLGSPLLQQLQWHENARNRVAENINTTLQRQQNEYTRSQELEVIVDQLTRELDEHKRYIQVLKVQLKEQDVAMQIRDEQNSELRTRTVQQAATIKHQSQLIQNPRSNIGTPSRGQENIAPINPSYTAPPPPGYTLNSEIVNARLNGDRTRHNTVASQGYNNPSTNRQYLNSAEQGSPGPNRITAGNDRTRHSSSNTNPFDSTPRIRQASTVKRRSNDAVDNSRALIPAGSSSVTGSADLTKGFEHVYKMVESFAKAHVNFVSSEKDGNMPHHVKQALLAAAAPVNAFPFMSKPESRYHMVAKVMTNWINKEIMKGISFATFNDKVDGVIEGTRNKIFQGDHRCLMYYSLSDTNDSHRNPGCHQGYVPARYCKSRRRTHERSGLQGLVPAALP
jgi:hypothetical protein